MQRILWLDDETVSISYERDVLIPEKFDNYKFEIITFEMIDELMEFITTEKIFNNDIFIIDIMLLSEDEIRIPQKKPIPIENDLMAGAMLYSEYLKEIFSENPFILYTSRENEKEIFQNILNDERYNKSLFLVEKSQKDTKLLEVLQQLIKE